MAESVKITLPQGAEPRTSSAALAPLREPLFRTLWLAAVISYTGTWMQNVGSGWLMTQLTMSPMMVSLVTAAAMLPVFLITLPAGALADMMDRRRLLLVTQGWMVLASGTLGLMTLTSCVGPWTLLLFTFLLGLGAVMNDPAWQAITPEVVSPQNHAAAVALNSAGFNVARVAGPAIGGLVVARLGSGWVFVLNSLSFFGVIFFLYHWKREHHEHVETRDVLESIRDGIRYLKSAPQVQAVLIRTGTFSVAAAVLLALLPVVAQPHGATGFGLVLTCFGTGALAGAAVLPALRARLSVDGVVGVAIVLFAGMVFAAGRVQTFAALCLAMFVAGTAWIGILACLNVAAQTMSPPGLRARTLSMYLLVLQGGMAIGSGIWGAVASRWGVPNAMTAAAVALVCGLVSVRRYRLSREQLQMAPAVVRD
jgi:MFS family permease